MTNMLTQTESELRQDPLLTQVESKTELQSKLKEKIKSMEVGETFKIIFDGKIKTIKKVSNSKIKVSED